MPLFVLKHPSLRPDFEDFARDLIRFAKRAVETTSAGTALREALKCALFGTYKKDQKTGKADWDFPTSRKDATTTQKSIISHTTTRFWKDTESAFYRLLGKAREALDEHLDADPDDTLNPLRAKWKETVRNKVLELFDEVTGYGTFHAVDPRSIAQARIELKTTLREL